MVLDKIRNKIAEKIGTSERVQKGWDRLYKEAGFIPILNITDLEARRKEIKKSLGEMENKIFEAEGVTSVQKSVVQKTFAMFWGEGSPWYRGLDNRELAQKVNDFLANCMDAGYLMGFMPDLFEEAMALLNYSWTEKDVTNTPVMIIESRPVVFPQKGAGGMTPETETDAMGQLEMRNYIKELEGKLAEKEE